MASRWAPVRRLEDPRTTRTQTSARRRRWTWQGSPHAWNARAAATVGEGMGPNDIRGAVAMVDGIESFDLYENPDDKARGILTPHSVAVVYDGPADRAVILHQLRQVLVWGVHRLTWSRAEWDDLKTGHEGPPVA